MKTSRERKKRIAAHSAKECAYIAVFVALVLALQLVLAALPNVEVVSALFICYAFVFGVRRGTAAATAFALLRQLVFGFFPTVLVLYLVYYNALTALFGWLGKRTLRPFKSLPLVVALACICTVGFTMFDNVITPLWYGYSAQAAKAYFVASLPFLGTHVVSVGVSTAILFFPLTKAFSYISKTLKR